MREIIQDGNEPIKDFKQIHQDAFVDVNAKLLMPPIAISIGTHQYKQQLNPNAFGTYGNFSCVVGASKARKSFFKSLLIASYIGGNTSEYAPDFKSHRDTDKFILDFDTEQSKYHSQKVFKRVCEIAGGTTKMYKPYSLRKYDFRERLEFIEWCMLESDYKSNIGLVSIDGFADFTACHPPDSIKEHGYRRRFLKSIRRLEGGDENVIADQHRHFIRVACVHCRITTTKVSFINYIVMHKRCKMNRLDRHCRISHIIPEAACVFR